MEGLAHSNSDSKEYLEREFPMKEDDFKQLSSIAYENTGILLTDHKRELVYGRIARRVRLLKLKNFSEYCFYLKNNVDTELGCFINAITTNLTSFFREKHHFEFLESTVCPELKVKHRTDSRIRIWSAGCSTGEEPYSIAISLRRAMGSAMKDVKVLATDLDTDVIRHAQSGIYNIDRIEGLDDHYVKAGFVKGRKDETTVKVKDEVQALVSFKQLNLMSNWPMKGKFDVIFCRNVVIYFDKATQKKLFQRYASILNDGGYLFIGHSESLHNVSDQFESLGRTIYRKV